MTHGSKTSKLRAIVFGGDPPRGPFDAYRKFFSDLMRQVGYPEKPVDQADKDAYEAWSLAAFECSSRACQFAVRFGQEERKWPPDLTIVAIIRFAEKSGFVLDDSVLHGIIAVASSEAWVGHEKRAFFHDFFTSRGAPASVTFVPLNRFPS